MNLSEFSDSDSSSCSNEDQKLFGFSCFDSTVNLKEILLQQSMKKNFSCDDVSIHRPDFLYASISKSLVVESNLCSMGESKKSRRVTIEASLVLDETEACRLSLERIL